MKAGGFFNRRVPALVTASLLVWGAASGVGTCLAVDSSFQKDFEKNETKKAVEKAGKAGGEFILNSIKDSSQLDVSNMSAKDSAAAFAKQDSLFGKLGAALKNLDLVGPIAKWAGEWSVNSTGAKYTALDEAGKKLAGAAGGATGAALGSPGGAVGAVVGGVVVASAVQAKWQVDVTPKIMDAALDAQTKEQQWRDYSSGGNYWRYQKLQGYKREYGVEEGRRKWQEENGRSGAASANTGGTAAGQSGSGTKKNEGKDPNCSDAVATVRDNIRDVAQSNVKDTVTDTIKDNVKDGVKDGVTTTVKDTCSDNCRDSTRGTTRDTVRNTTRDSCGGGGACRP